MKRLFLDASFVVALELSSDAKHDAARTFWSGLDRKGVRFVTTDLVLAEILAYLNGFGLHQKTVEVGSWMLFNEAVDLVILDRKLIVEGYDYLSRYQDKRYSLADCVSFVLMKKSRLDTALTFDRHFVQAGFTTLP